mmetsp:Transcript_26820/g.69148  ORF Transcript_26820/g.69148 Transcript_26820/m.69148 type:complete len:223 (+) Transcript_26820:864-1532(+)
MVGVSAAEGEEEERAAKKVVAAKGGQAAKEERAGVRGGTPGVGKAGSEVAVRMAQEGMAAAAADRGGSSSRGGCQNAARSGVPLQAAGKLAAAGSSRMACAGVLSGCHREEGPRGSAKAKGETCWVQLSVLLKRVAVVPQALSLQHRLAVQAVAEAAAVQGEGPVAVMVAVEVQQQQPQGLLPHRPQPTVTRHVLQLRLLHHSPRQQLRPHSGLQQQEGRPP